MDPFISSSSPEDWWAEVDLPCSPEASESCVLSALPLPSDFTPLSSPRPKPASSRKGHLRCSPKDQHLRMKESVGKDLPSEEVMWNDLLQDMYLDELTVSPSVCASEASTAPSSFIFKTSKQPDPCVQSILTCADKGDLDLCTTDEKRRIADELRARLKSIEGGIASLKASLKKLIKDKI